MHDRFEVDRESTVRRDSEIAIHTMKKQEKPQTKSANPKSGMKVRTQLKASGPVLQHNEKLVREKTSASKPAKKSGMKVRTQVKASGPFLQHNEKLVRR